MKTVDVNPLLQRNYDEYYENDLSEWRGMGALDKAENIRQLCAAITPSSILDIGAGEGSVLQRLSAVGVGKRHFALDISASGVERVRSRQIPTLIECQQFDGYTIPYADDSFDLAILSHVVEHVEHPRMLLSEAGRVAQYAFIEVPLEYNRRLPADFVWDSVGHINFYTAKSIRLLVQSCGFEVVDQRQTHAAKRMYVYRHGRKGIAAYLLKELALRTVPSIAQALWTYHSSLLVRCRR